MPFGSELALTPGLSPMERLYIRIFGAPILGLRVRARTIISFLNLVGNPQRIADAGSGRGMITSLVPDCFRKRKSSALI